MAEINIQDPGENQNKSIDARLWEDPFAALGKSLDKSQKEQLRSQCDAGQHPRLENHPECFSPLQRESSEGRNALVIGVMMTDAPYAEDSEHRRRTRYAVLAGLEQKSFAPEDARHIYYFVWNQRGKHSHVAPIIPYEKFHSKKFDQDIIVVWLKDGIFDKDFPIEDFWSLRRFIFDNPFASVATKIGIRQLALPTVKSNNNPLIILGPNSSNKLHEMIAEAKNCKNISDCPLPIKSSDDFPRIRFYSYSANASNAWLSSDRDLPKAIANDKNWCEHHQEEDDSQWLQYSIFNNTKINIERSLPTDFKLSHEMACELQKRMSEDQRKNYNIVLISEWDTLYGQYLPMDMTSELCHVFGCGAGDAALHVFPYTYLRGLDGQLPAHEANELGGADKSAPTSSPGDKENTAVNFFRTQPGDDKMDRPVGQGQFDYLRRIDERLQKISENLRLQGGKRKIDAIGILGSDVFDKLLILRALSPDFPDTLFFTTGFDEAYTMQSELPWTRNLIISSSFGPRLSSRHQGQAPSFRDSRQTQAFLATQLAIDDAEAVSGNTEAARNEATEDAKALRREFQKPRIFEIERNGYPLPLVNFIPDAAPKDSSCPDAETCEDLPQIASKWFGWKARAAPSSGTAASGDAQEESLEERESAYLYPTYELTSRYNLFSGLTLLGLLAGAALFSAKVRKWAGVEVAILGAGLFLGAGLVADWGQFASWLTEHGKGEPLVILEGVSVWPTVLLRLLGIFLALYFIWLSKRRLTKNLLKISRENGLDIPQDATASFFGNREESYILNKVMKLFHPENMLGAFNISFGLKERRRSEDDRNQTLQIGPIWDAYVRQERFARRFWRVTAYVAAMMIVNMLIVFPVFGWPSFPFRGVLSYNLYTYTTFTYVIMMNFVVFFVFDATVFCLLFVRKLCAKKSEWPETTMTLFGERLKLPRDTIMHDWIDLDFVIERTRCVGSLVYFPFVLLALLVLSRSTVFANFAPNLSLLVAQGLCLMLVFVSTIMLWWAATTVRDTTKQNLMNRIISAKSGAGETKGYAGQLEVLLQRVEQLKEGAFGPITQQPLVRAVLLPLGSFGWASLIEKGIFPGF